MPAPMPGLVADTVGIAARVGHDETEFSGVAAEPAEGGGMGELLLDAHIFGRADVDGAAGLVFAEAGGGDETEEVGRLAAGGEIGPDDARLAGDAAKAGEWVERDVIGCGGGLHAAPSSGGTWGEADRFFVGRMMTHEDKAGYLGLMEGAHAARAAVVGRNTKGAMEDGEGSWARH